MEQDVDKKMEEWAERIGEEKFIQITNSINTTLDQIETIAPNDALLAACEGELLELFSGIITRDVFFENMDPEIEIASLDPKKSEQVVNLLKKIIAEIIPPPPTIGVPTKNTFQEFTRTQLKTLLTPPTPVTPTVRDYSLENSNINSETKEVQHIDPYREIPEK